jgi:hypothetical protein
MRGTGVEHDDSDFAEAWRAFEQEDAAFSTPPSVHTAVMAAWRTRERTFAAERSRPRRVERLALAAGILIVLGAATLLQRASPDRDVGPPDDVIARVIPASPPRGATPGVAPSRVAPARQETAVGRASARAPKDETAIADREPLQLVRVRMPREGLTALGVSLVEPEAASLVDVELLIAHDGMPRGIRNVTAVIEPMERE